MTRRRKCVLAAVVALGVVLGAGVGSVWLLRQIGVTVHLGEQQRRTVQYLALWQWSDGLHVVDAAGLEQEDLSGIAGNVSVFLDVRPVTLGPVVLPISTEVAWITADGEMLALLMNGRAAGAIRLDRSTLGPAGQRQAAALERALRHARVVEIRNERPK